MAKGLPGTSYTEVNKSVVPPATLTGAHGVITQTLFGQADKAYTVASLSDLTTLFGGPGAGSPNFAQLRRAVVRGTTLHVQRLLPTGASAALILLTGPKVTFTAKDMGAFANGTLGVVYTPAVVGPPATPATLQVVYTPDTSINETFTADTFANLITLVNATSKRVIISTASGFTEPPANTNPIFLAAGSDGVFASQTTTDTAIQSLLSRFDSFTDMSSVFSPDSHSQAHLSNLKAYVELRADIMGLFELDPTLSASAAVTAAQALTGFSSFIAIYYSSIITASSPEQGGALVTGGCLCDIAAVWSASDTITGNAFKAPAGSRRGLIPNVTSFATNMLSPGNLTAANAINDAGVNIVGVDSSYGPVVWGAQTFAQSDSSFDAINVRRGLFSLRAKLTPIYRSEEFEPMNPVTWRDAYGQAKAVLDAMVSENSIYPQYTYIGDQEASVISDAKYNQPIDLGNGIYKVQIQVVFQGYIEKIAVEVDVDNLLSLFSAGIAA